MLAGSACLSVSAQTQSLGNLLGIRAASSASTFGSAVARAPKATQANAEGVTICASVVYPDNAQGIWSYNTSSWNPTRLSVNPDILATGGGFAAPNGYYYITRYREMMGFEEIKTVNYKMSDWSEYDTYTGQINYVATTMAYSPLRDEVYGCFINEDRTGYNFVRWNYEYFRPQATICALERPWSGCAFSADGTLYAIERNGDLYTVSLRDGAMTLVGNTGVTSDYLGDATIDTNTDTMYWSVTTDTDFGLYAVDITNATATKVYDLVNEEQLCGMYIPFAAPEIAAEAPAKISSVSTSFSGTALTGKISFNAPTYNSAQSAALSADETLTYEIKANGKVVATGECAPKVRVTVDVTLEEADNYYFTITTSNAAGTSAAYGTHKFVGPDQPKAPTSFTTKIVGNTVTLNWSSPSSSGVNGGNVNYSAAVYNVVRYPDMKVVAENISAKTITDELPNPEVRTEYYYVLSTTVEGLQAPDVKSAAIAMGPLTPSFTADFTTATSTAGWTILDVNDDNTKWVYYSYDKALQLYGSKGHDDWAITPAVNVKGGTSYPVSITLKTSSYYEESFELMWGTEPTAEAMVNPIIEKTSFKSYAAQTFTGELQVAEGGRIYIGIHGCSGTPSNTLNFVSLTVESGQTAAAPAAATEFTAESPVSGAREVSISFVLPTSDLAGQPLEGESALTKVEILRDGAVIKTFTEDLTPGAKIEFVDNADDLTLGNHLYAVVASNAYGEGTQVEAQVLVGARKPVAPASAWVVEDGNTGTVKISWEPVTTDFQGNEIAADAVTYRIINRKYETIAEGVTETTFTYTAVPEGEQEFCQFAVYAATAGGESDKMAATVYKPVGAPYSTPWGESFANKSVSSIFGYHYIKGTEPWQFVSQHDWGFTSQDNDNGFAFLECYGDLTALVTGKIDLDGIANPAFIYYTYNYSSGSTYSNALEIQIDCNDGRGFVPVQRDVVAETGPTNQWNKVVVPLYDFEGQTVIIRIEPQTPGLAMYTLDNLRVTSYTEFNLSAGQIVAPAVADIDKPFEVEVAVSNTGENAINSYIVELFNGEELIATAEGSRIQPSETKTTTFEATLSVLHGEYAQLSANIVCDVDEVESDNTTAIAEVGIVGPAVPGAHSLNAVAGMAGVQLTWGAPDLTAAAPAHVTETFESAESWSNQVEGWKFVDQDKAPVGGIQTENFPCTGMQSFFVADQAWAGFPESGVAAWAAHSGTKFLASEYVVRGGQNVQSDDWAITPRLNSASHAISFYAKSFNANYPESFEVLASAGTTNIDDFVSVGSASDITSAWRQYRFKLPEGTKYAAIRSRSINKFFLFIDDVAYIPAEGEPAEHQLLGYHVYRNGARITAQPVAEQSFMDEFPPVATHKYFVTAVYAAGESRPSEHVEVEVKDNSFIGDAATDVVTITAGQGLVTVSNLAEGTVTVATVDGRIIASREAAPTVHIALTPGIYVVNAGNKVAKVVVK